MRPDFSLSAEDRAQLTTLLRNLVRIPSVSGQEGAVAAYIVDYCRRMGLEPVTIDEAGNVLGMMPHPERAGEALVGGTDGNRIWESLLAAAATMVG